MTKNIRSLLLALVAATTASSLGCPGPTIEPPPPPAREVERGERLAARYRGPTPSCGAEVRLTAALVDPRDRPDREGEWVELQSLHPDDLSLYDWTLELGRRRLDLPQTVLEPGQRLRIGASEAVASRPDATLGALRLTNLRGALRLRDPCGLEISRLEWGRDGPAPAGEVLRPAAPCARHGKPLGSRERGGGCGQT